MNNRPRNPRKLMHKGLYQKNSKGSMYSFLTEILQLPKNYHFMMQLRQTGTILNRQALS
jgi:hypothetical protein